MEKMKKKIKFRFLPKLFHQTHPAFISISYKGQNMFREAFRVIGIITHSCPKKISHNRNSSCYLKKSQILTDFSLYVGDGFESYIEANKGWLFSFANEFHYIRHLLRGFLVTRNKLERHFGPSTRRTNAAQKNKPLTKNGLAIYSHFLY